ncbi:MAG TPA: 3-phosphoshikimate 1-carboxyvinyltransferase, partial [Chitinophagaceae bacterium]
MKVTIYPSQLKGIVRAPASKSSLQRALAASLLRKGETVIHNPGHSNDDKAAIEIIKALGAGIIAAKDKLVVNSEGFPFTIHHSPVTINCGESGLSIRMFTP